MSRLSVVSVLAGGWSVRGLDLARLPGVVVAVNEAGVLAPKVDSVVTMDRLWLEHRWEDLDRLQRRDGRRIWARPAALLNIIGRPHWLSIFDCDWQTAEMADRDDGVVGRRLNGTNSGLCALNLAYQMRPARVVLFGFDMGRSPKGEAYWHENYPWRPNGGTSNAKYAEWARQFDPAARAFKAAGIEVLNASPASRIPAFPKVAPNEVLI